MIPLIHNLKGKRVLIFGGGEVGFRKASFFYPEADITVVSRSFSENLKNMDVVRIELDINSVSDANLLKMVSGSAVIVAATSDRDINNHLGHISKEAGILFNNADGEEGDITIPSSIRGKNYLIAISTEGKSPGVSRYLRRLLEEYCPSIDEMIELQFEIREQLKSKEPDQKKRNSVLRQILDDETVWIKLEKDKDSAIKYIEGKYLQ
ncbi:MAG: bifunctional precorrin-2 dehydrogenase/sirohydrochlorin ferrochelatase [Methanomicrobiaceae archaeon]|nr:bifunctional precorrin-2 dehydrogenase/sirohydrochlorin ferrochelatase [Methanomicrobiaceae archaeon]